MAATKPEPIRTAIIVITPTGQECRATVVTEGNEALIAGWVAKIKAGTDYPVVTKSLAPAGRPTFATVA